VAKLRIVLVYKLKDKNKFISQTKNHLYLAIAKIRKEKIYYNT